MAMLKGLDFVHVLPGHGRRMRFSDIADKDACIVATIKAEAEDAESPEQGRRIVQTAEQAVPLYTGA